MNKKTEKKIAVYPGSFNPVHPGHLHTIRQAAQVFDTVYVVVMDNPAKKYDVDDKIRAEWIKGMIKGFDWSKHVKVEYCYGPLVDYCKVKKAKFIVRGIRNGVDLEFERAQQQYNEVLSDEPANINYVYFAPPKHSEHLSSTFVRQFIQYATLDKFQSLYFLGGWGSFPDTITEIFKAYGGL